MSMINRMLSDLERRGAPKPSTGDGELVADRPPARRRPDLRRVFPLLLAVVLVLVAGALWVERGDRVLATWQAMTAPAATQSGRDASGDEVVKVASEADDDPEVDAAAATAQETAQVDTASVEVAVPGEAETRSETEAERESRAESETRAENESEAESKAVSDSAREPAPEGEAGDESTGETQAASRSREERAAGDDDTQAAASTADDSAAGNGADGREDPAAGETRVEAEMLAESGAEVRKSQSLTPKKRAHRRYREGRRALEAGRLGEARRMLAGALELDPALHPARDLLVSLARRAGDDDTARRLLGEGIELAPGRLVYAMPYARLLVDTDELERAADVLARADGEGNAGFHALEAAVAQRRGQHEQAARAYTRALEIDADNGLWWLGLGISLAASGHPDEARAAFREARASGDLGESLDRWTAGRIEDLGGEG